MPAVAFGAWKATLKELRGVKGTTCGYANGRTENPSYEDVCRHDTGHAETVKVDFDDEVISLEDLLIYYFRIIDPVSVNKQGNDVGTQYSCERSYFCGKINLQ